MCGLSGYILALALWLSLIAFVLGITVLSIGIGLSIGIFPGIFFAVRNYFQSINENITNPIMKVVSYISLGLGVAAAIVVPVVFIVLSFII